MAVEEQTTRSGKALERFEIIRDLSTPRTDVESTDKTGSCIASYYPMIGVFDTKERMDKAFKRTQRPGETVKIESQVFDNVDRAVGALQGRHPKFVMEGLNNFQMAEMKTTPSTWAIPEGALLLGGLILVALMVGAVLHPTDKSGGGTIVFSMTVPKGTTSGKTWADAEGAGAGQEIQTRVEPQSGPTWTTTEECSNSAMSGKRPDLEEAYAREATMNEMKSIEYLTPQGAPW